tara:strand:+ start:1910 stop:3286 length:1377 start_codon:yes stop_codon:yes gene_type:complete
MKTYFDLLGQIAPLDRCHCGPEMEKAYNFLTEHYEGSRKLFYPCNEKIHHWIIPPYWECTKATLKDSRGNLIADKNRNNLEVYSYSPSFNGEVTLEELDNHIISDPERPDSILFHFRNQYRHWEPKWGFCIPDKVRKKLKNETYSIEIDSSFDFSKEMIQSDYLHPGEKKDEFLFMGHFDHPSMVNDGLSGCLAAFEIIHRLKGRKTKYSYRAFASVEVIGSVAYLLKEEKIAKNLKEALFLGFVGIESQMVYQQSFGQNSQIDKAVRHIFEFCLSSKNSKNVFSHRELAGNDENVFDSVGYEIPCGTLLRSPFPEYHTQFDNMSITSEEKIEEIISTSFKIIDILENNCFIKANFKGIPCLSNKEINLYLAPEKASNLVTKNQLEQIEIDDNLYYQEKIYLENNTHLLYPFMNNVVRMANGEHSLLEICNLSNIPFFFGLSYVKKMEEKQLLIRIPV